MKHIEIPDNWGNLPEGYSKRLDNTMVQHLHIYNQSIGNNKEFENETMFQKKMTTKSDPIVASGIFMGTTKAILDDLIIHNLYPKLGKDLEKLTYIFNQGILPFYKKPFLIEIKKQTTILLEPALHGSNNETKKKSTMDIDSEKLAVSSGKPVEGTKGVDDRKTDNELPIEPKGSIMEVTKSSMGVLSETQTHILESSNQDMEKKDVQEKQTPKSPTSQGQINFGGKMLYVADDNNSATSTESNDEESQIME